MAKKVSEKERIGTKRGKVKNISFPKRQRDPKDKVWQWEGKEIEKVKEFSYLGFKLQRNGDVKKHVRERIRKANILIREVWRGGGGLAKNLSR